jgi:hypothetical protein
VGNNHQSEGSNATTFLALLKKSYLPRRKGHYSVGEGKVNIFFNHSAREENINGL